MYLVSHKKIGNLRNWSTDGSLNKAVFNLTNLVNDICDQPNLHFLGTIANFQNMLQTIK